MESSAQSVTSCIDISLTILRYHLSCVASELDNPQLFRLRILAYAARRDLREAFWLLDCSSTTQTGISPQYDAVLSSRYEDIDSEQILQ